MHHQWEVFPVYDCWHLLYDQTILLSDTISNKITDDLGALPVRCMTKIIET